MCKDCNHPCHCDVIVCDNLEEDEACACGTCRCEDTKHWPDWG
jgi:hypothetical protein